MQDFEIYNILHDLRIRNIQWLATSQYMTGLFIRETSHISDDSSYFSVVSSSFRRTVLIYLFVHGTVCRNNL